MQMSYLYASDFPFKIFFKLAQHAEAIRKKLFGKRVMRCTRWDKSIDHLKPHFNSFFTTISMSKKMVFLRAQAEKGIASVFLRAQAEKGIARHIDTSSVDSYQQWQISQTELPAIVVEFNIPMFRYFYNHLSIYTKTIIRLRLVNIGEYSLCLRRIIVKYLAKFKNSVGGVHSHLKFLKL